MGEIRGLDVQLPSPLAKHAELSLDEPGNHLDDASRQLFVQVLVDYPGTLLRGSHDPDFVAGVGLEYMLG
ncbi:hypothetical protein AAW02_13050 [Aeromonas dhakensis]|uniref:hypothetical protein n=1 Tax=Aeromonas dhakensis TaxID=196024 RepID=UPI000C0BF48E|nr:hypothetical protein [Aeromonas dhakensis]PHS85897.1 hypothetical protein AAW03_11775 [Aeromonas dhakensis]PHS86823.1 hypothetical protein AAW02_13050 [Aeromonas dhakensis]